MKNYLPQRIGFVIKRENTEADNLALDLALTVLGSHHKRQVYFDEDASSLAKKLTLDLKGKIKSSKINIVPKADLVQLCELIIVLGGDGTFLSIARLMKDRSVPVLGVNMGLLGFLTEIKKDEAHKSLNLILSGKPPLLSQRLMLEVELHRKRKKIYSGLAVNDVVVSKGAIARIIGMGIYINDKWMSDVRADGMIICTPTGSTAYSLAAGGPILAPTVSGLILTPICPHSLTQRPVVVEDSVKIKLELKDRPGHVQLTLDGQEQLDLKKNDIVIIKKYTNQCLELVSSPTRDYFHLLREKLNFGQRS